MPHPFQSLVNSWVKINSKHVVFPRTEGNDDRPVETQSRTSSGTKAGSPQSIKSALAKGEEHVSHDTEKTLPSTTPADPETLAIRRIDTRRQNRRGLQRTVSHSDLLREMAKEKGKAEEKESVGGGGPRSSPNATDSFQDKSGEENGQPPQRSLLRPTPQYVSRPQKTPTTGKYLNEAVFVQQMEQARAQHRRVLSSGAASADGRRSTLYSEGGRGPDDVKNMLEDSILVASTASKFSGGREGPHSEPGPAGMNGLVRDHNAQVTSSPRLVDRKSECALCEELAQRLQASRVDLEHLRTVALRTEYTCRICKEQKEIRLRSTTMRPQTGSSNSPGDASKRLVELATSHRRQIEQMTKERSRWRTDMQVKLSKITMICKELNEENGIRKQAAASLESELQTAREERNILASEVEQLRAQLSLYEEEETEFRLLQETSAQNETGALDSADEGIQQRNKVAADLSYRMERTMEILEAERHQQRQRRQIIFPVQRSVLSHRSLDESPTEEEFASLQEELRQAKESARKTEQLLASTRFESDKNEAALRIRCEDLERQLLTLQSKND